ncbi:cytochrome P450 [Mycolicibacterium pulveris]|uniref:Steroid C26-monooxygenase n=1 Tax=Mycolicibacterium pulveris TaxID=36813 RepID=A0A7I7ULZ3_MYCPV|nr:cytochrome P450 [Mycolicibacterium pulveris]MCV6979411.1 cytochrome P450 [Mycolicibacterium pulveris]BBY81146.1 cytochrome P450 hydroxylase [Mycolicibacterium pulveris]
MTTATTRPASVFDADLPVLDYRDLSDPTEAHARLASARTQSVFGLGPYGPEILRYAEVRAVLRDSRFINPPALGLDTQGMTSGPLWERATASILAIDGAAHTRLRRLVAKAFSPRAVARMQGLVQQTAVGLVEALAAAGSGDIVTDLSHPYPTPIICALLGAPPRDWHLFSGWADAIMKIFDWNIEHDGPVIKAAWEELDDYLDAMVGERRSTLTDDLISELIRAEDDGDRLTHSELLMLAGSLLAAGTDTTRNQLAAAVEALVDRPDQWELLASRPDLSGRAVEELVRYAPAVFGAMRYATEDVDIAGVTIPAGTLVFANTAAANRDPVIFDHPERLDITRHNPSPILTFGGGTHYCLGAHLARLELTEALHALTTRCPRLHRTGASPWKKLTGVTGPTTLPVTAAPGARPRER